jgi:hypothetical protein
MTMLKPRNEVLIMLILAAALTRLIPHPFNFTSVGAVALFSGAYLGDKRAAFLVPLAAMLLSDLILGFYAHMEWVYGSFALIVCIGLSLRSRRRAGWIAGGCLAGSALFFVITNFGVWALGSLYPKSLAGLMACYAAAIPFFGNTVLGDGFYSLMLFGGFALLERRFESLREPALPGAAMH